MKVLYFASLREKLGRDSESFSVEESTAFATVAQLKECLMQRDDAWRVIGENSTRVAVNQKLANDSTALHSDDEVAFFPPVTGG